MSFITRLQTPLARVVTSRALRALEHGTRETVRQARGAPHVVTWFHRADDPASLLLAQVLPAFLERYPVQLECRTIGEPGAAISPEPALRARFALRDAVRVAAALGLELPGDAVEPQPGAVAAAKQRLVEAERGSARDYLALAVELGAALYGGRAVHSHQSVVSVVGQLSANEARLRRLGHFASALLHYGGEWYHGLDRMEHLERRLAALGVGEGHAVTRPAPPQPAPLPPSTRLEAFVSLRSPYSWLALDRVVDLARRWQLELAVRPVLPMVQRGLPVPLAKRIAIVRDAQREADALGIAFGRVVDPLPGVQRALAVWADAEPRGLGTALLRSALQGAFADGIDLGSRRGLRLVCERAGIAWPEARAAMRDDTWRERVERHRDALGEHGLWGVPSFAVGEFATWGQDRLWLLERHLGAIASARGGEVRSGLERG